LELVCETKDVRHGSSLGMKGLVLLPIGSMYAIYANIGGILMGSMYESYGL
jgi:hypothetical protein